ncbi:MAG: N-acetylmuramoyl-L-alanine amidase [Bacillota bacterium]
MLRHRPLATAVVSILALACVLAVPVLADTISVSDQQIVLRSAPADEAPANGVLLPGGQFTVVGQQGDWVAVQVGTIRGWLPSSLLSTVTTGPVARRLTVNTAVLNARLGPGTEHAILSTVKAGEQYDIAEEKNGWFKIILRNGHFAWVSGDYVLVSTVAANQPPAVIPLPVSSEKVATVAVSAAYVRTGTNTRYEAKGLVRQSTRLPVVDVKDGWVQVVYKTNDLGWVEGSLLKLADVNRPTGEVLYSIGNGAFRIEYPSSGMVDGSVVNLRSGPGLTYPVQAQVRRDDRVIIVGQRDGWYNIVWQGKTYWIYGPLVKGVTNGTGLTIALQATGANAGLVIEGINGTATVAATGQTLIVTLPQEATAASLPVNTGPVRDIAVSGRQVVVNFTNLPNYSVESAAGRTSISFRNLVTAAAWEKRADREVVVFQGTGELWGKLDFSHGLALDLSSSSRLAGLGTENPARVAVDGSGTRIMFERRPARTVLRQGERTLTLELLEPGLAGKVILLDPGHGGMDSGAIGRSAGTYEKTINLAVALLLKGRLEAAGATVHLTRSGDYRLITDAEYLEQEYPKQGAVLDLQRRAELTTTLKPDIFLSIHCNSHPYSREGGTETYYFPDSGNGAESLTLAALVQREVTASLGTADRGVKSQQFWVIKNANTPAALVELAFLSNAAEERMLRAVENQLKAAEALYRALEAYFGGGQ